MHARPDVILIQGYFTTPTSIAEMTQFMTASGLNCSVPSLGGVSGLWQTDRVKRSGTALAEYIRNLPTECKPWLVGHSLGGILARYAVQLGGVSDRVQGVLTIGSPHSGCRLAVVAAPLGFGFIGRAAFDLLPTSRVMRRLNTQRWPKHVPLVSVTSDGDLLCRPKDGRFNFRHACASGRQILLRGIGHTELVRQPRLLGSYVELMKNQRHAFV